jgi:D-glycero-beta-D-manno-heptose-7-phosphate kinase
MHLTIQRDRLLYLLEAAARTRVLVAGDVMLDEYLSGDVERISPEAPVPVVRVRERRHALGGAANVAQNVVATGAQCHVVAAVGDDDAGAMVAAMLTSLGVSTSGLLRVPRPTTRKTRIVARSQQVVRVDEEDDDDLPSHDIDRALTAIESAVQDVDAVVLEDYNKGMLTPSLITRAMDLARARKLPVVVDPKYRHFFSYRGATVLKNLRLRWAHP